jgi:riboflavin biosynthesis pyrimidine reductase
MTRFEEYCARKTRESLEADIGGFETIQDDSSAFVLSGVGNAWTRRMFDGTFYVSATPATPGPAVTPRVNLVIVQSLEGNTEAPDPSILGGGETDKHLIYEGLSRVEVDAVLVGAKTANEKELVFSVWHPEIVSLRQDRGRSRHPIQVVVTERADLPLETALLYTTPSIAVVVITGTSGATALAHRVRGRPWIGVVDAGQPLSIRRGLQELSNLGVRAVSAIGGRRTATSLLREGLVSDLYVTTSSIRAGTPGTPFYEGPPLRLDLVLEKRGRSREAGVRFHHWLVRST